MSGAGSDALSDLFAIAARELRTVVRTPAVVALSVVFGLTVVAVAAAGSGARGGYVPLVLDLVPFVEALVPLLAVALCYRAVLSDRESGELDVLRTFDVSRPAYVGGVYLGRGLALAFVVFGSLLAAGATVPVLSPPDPTFLALNEAADSPVAFLRFAVLAVLFALAVAAVALAVSAAARTARQAIALAVGLLVAFVVGIDAAAVAGLASGTLGIDAVPLALAVSPNGAFRSLVVGVAVETGGGGSPAAALAGLVGWVVVALAVAVLTAWRPVE
ncbi:ABC transporter permease [Haloferax volcanii]|uniref:ABC transporter permease n=1 Tax=Haloferax volcanii TaxID=2246 RepID=UPI00385B29FF